MSNNTDTFESFGIGFQNCVLQGLITDRVFFEKSFETLKDDYFTSDAHKTLWTEIRKLFNKYNTPPSVLYQEKNEEEKRTTGIGDLIDLVAFCR